MDSNHCRRKPTDLQSIPRVCGRFQLTGVRAGEELGLIHVYPVPQGISALDADLAEAIN